MSKKEYTRLDRLILAAIAEGREPIYCPLCMDEGTRLASWPRRLGWRVVDRRKQALRRNGKIVWEKSRSGKYAWVISSPSQDHKTREPRIYDDDSPGEQE